MSAAETVDQYVERFNNLRRLAQIQGRCVLTHCVLIGLQADIYKKVIVSLANCMDAQKESVDYVVKLAKAFYYSLYKVRRIANAVHTSAGPSMVNDSTSGQKESSGFIFGSAAHTALYPKDSKKKHPLLLLLQVLPKLMSHLVLLPLSGIQETNLPVWDVRAALVVLTTGVLVTDAKKKAVQPISWLTTLLDLLTCFEQ
ncbi:hypothetical protein G6F37_012570 [Rhizopus arrhizus]|nr:hypothetical protein G6F38_010578 [Rhizopus arrhizus]KAG1142820.1 hypothetical protein G6F37_012570 [Rhizopus arrhizus]